MEKRGVCGRGWAVLNSVGFMGQCRLYGRESAAW